MAVQLIYETHSITVDNEIGVATGWLPGDLSDAGVCLAQELGVRRRHDGVDVVFTSDLRRAVQTAQIAFGGSGIPVNEDWRLREANYGDLNGMSHARLQTERLQRIDVPFPAGESWRQSVQRTWDFLDELARDFDGKRIVVIGHSAQRHALRMRFENMTLEEALEAPFAWQEGWEYLLVS